MRRLLAVSLAVSAIAGGAARPADASCVYISPEQQFATADVIFDGVALEGATATGIQRFRVLAYIKSSGPDVARIRTGTRLLPGGLMSTTSVAVDAQAGDTWRIYAMRRADGTLATSVCHGSRRLAAPGASRWRPAATVSGRFGVAALVDARGDVVPTVSVRRGEVLRIRFNFRPTSVTVRHGNSAAQRLPPRRTVTWRVGATGTYLLDVTATGTPPTASGTATRVTSRLRIRLRVRP